MYHILALAYMKHFVLCLMLGLKGGLWGTYFLANFSKFSQIGVNGTYSQSDCDVLVQWVSGPLSLASQSKSRDPMGS